ncbi:hypothetical protein NPIL_560731 [Nephila pilipes]|uniref:Uncharacterized protein n=1 Tax=Nephila pilipes TaxID=299642 RepID=A0A8X6Q116_NEPPI|nr:hypothetical protein NPIL_560731 [Nephila pilipes]
MNQSVAKAKFCCFVPPKCKIHEYMYFRSKGFMRENGNVANREFSPVMSQFDLDKQNTSLVNEFEFHRYAIPVIYYFSFFDDRRGHISSETEDITRLTNSNVNNPCKV